MISQNELKYFASLLDKKHRREERKFLCEGLRLVDEGLRSSFKCLGVFVTAEFEENNPDFMNKIAPEIRVECLRRQDFLKISDTKNPQGIAAVFEDSIQGLPENPKGDIIALEGINDPGNLGTILRTCDWFGIKNIILSRDCADLLNSKTIRSSMGAVFHCRILRTERFCDQLRSMKKKGFRLLTADMKGSNALSQRYEGNLIIALANEANGPSAELLSISDDSITIPKYGEVESLNVASAAAIIISRLIKR